MSEAEIIKKLSYHIAKIAPKKSFKGFSCMGCKEKNLGDMWAISIGICNECCNRIARALDSAAKELDGERKAEETADSGTQ